jgi:hypothetical protein
MLSDFIDRTKYVEDERLIPNLYNKTKYVVHQKNLQLYTSLGMTVTRIQSSRTPSEILAAGVHCFQYRKAKAGKVIL